MRFLKLLVLILVAGCSSSVENSLSSEYLDLEPTKFVLPRYPKVALESNLSGYVVMTFNINKQGDVTNIVVVESNPKGIFDKAAVQALSKWKYEPHKDVEFIAQIQKLVFKI
ncbi:Protein TonB [Vibrio chagasii]|nr:Protein TonB [Vibrio chagasii]CAH6876886.1 Protein TonB [Vibrio chagasii]CAH6934577.1 Energy transducer TonB [Vibrio chagasii]CAH7053198.1 Energy transducer TonB [Vibrio chagasii]CAH7055151.1 Protein TonB [Vibrio chagasii]